MGSAADAGGGGVLEPQALVAARAPHAWAPCRHPRPTSQLPGTLAQGGYEGGSFVTRFSAWLNATFPHPGHRIINHGLPAVTSALFASCFDKVPEVGGRWAPALPAAGALKAAWMPASRPLQAVHGGRGARLQTHNEHTATRPPISPPACLPCPVQDTDLVVLDFAVNDGHVGQMDRDRDGYSFGSGARRGFEQLVRAPGAAGSARARG